MLDNVNSFMYNIDKEKERQGGLKYES